jgi:hypothetical protein
VSNLWDNWFGRWARQKPQYASTPGTRTFEIYFSLRRRDTFWDLFFISINEQFVKNSENNQVDSNGSFYSCLCGIYLGVHPSLLISRGFERVDQPRQKR